MDLSNLATDLEKEVEGVWKKVDSETSILVARYGNDRFSKAMQRLVENAPKVPKGLLVISEKDDSEYEDKLNKIIAETILLGWSGMKQNGEELAYSVEEAYRVLSDPKLKSFKEFVLKLSMESANYREKDIEETSVN